MRHSTAEIDSICSAGSCHSSIPSVCGDLRLSCPEFYVLASPRRLFVGQCGDATADQLAALFGPFAARGLRALHLLRKGCAMVLYERWAEGESPDPTLGFNRAPKHVLSCSALYPRNGLAISTHGSRVTHPGALGALAVLSPPQCMRLQLKLPRKPTMGGPGLMAAGRWS